MAAQVTEHSIGEIISQGDLSTNAIEIVAYIAMEQMEIDDSFWFSPEQVSADLGIPLSDIRDGFRELFDKGFFVRKSKGVMAFDPSNGLARRKSLKRDGNVVRFPARKVRSDK